MTRVMIVDDEEDIRLLTRLILEGAGYEVIEASGGQEALDLLEAGPVDLVIVDLVIVDIRMPGMDGWELMGLLDERGHATSTRVLAFSAHVEPEVLQAAVDRGCAGILLKPFSPIECLEAVRAALA